MDNLSHADIVLFGGTGDLAMRMLLPSLYHLKREKYLPEDTRVIAVSRSDLERSAYQDKVGEALKQFVPPQEYDDTAWQDFKSTLDYIAADASAPNSLDLLAERLGDRPSRRLFYLSTPPSLFAAICNGLKTAGLTGEEAHVALEKPIGHDRVSSEEINEQLAQAFPEERIFRVDHYLGKATVQNLLALRFANSIFEPIWNSHGIDHVQITVSETLGVEGRREFYDEVGALRDMVQSHMLQLLALIAMEPPDSLSGHAVQDEKLKVIRALRPIGKDDVSRRTVRGQYVAGRVNGEVVSGYGDGEEAKDTPTFVALEAYVDNWRWAGVPFFLRTGKRMAERATEIVVQFNCVPHSIFGSEGGSHLHANKLVIRLQPEENIELQVMNSLAGIGLGDMNLKAVSLNLSLSDHAKAQRRRIAYERLLLDALKGNGTLFVGRREVEACWAWIDGIIDGWQAHDATPGLYRAGSWGPDAAEALVAETDRAWHNPAPD